MSSAAAGPMGFSVKAAANGNTVANLSQPLILGFAHAVDSEVIHLSPFRHPTRLVTVLRVTANGAAGSTVGGAAGSPPSARLSFDVLRVCDVPHDANKLYVSLRSLPIGSEVRSHDLEDIGVHFEVHEQRSGDDVDAERVRECSTANLGAAHGGRTQYHYAEYGILSALVGGGWLTSDTRAVHTDRVLVAVSRDGGLTFCVSRLFRVGELFMDPVIVQSYDSESTPPIEFIDQSLSFDGFIERVHDLLPLAGGDVVLPILMPRRFERPEGLIFVG